MKRDLAILLCLSHTYISTWDPLCHSVISSLTADIQRHTALQCSNVQTRKSFTCLFVANLRPGDTSPIVFFILKCMDSLRTFQFFFPRLFTWLLFFRQGSVGVKKSGWRTCNMYIIHILYSLKLMAKCTWTLMAFEDYVTFFFRETC